MNFYVEKVKGLAKSVCVYIRSVLFEENPYDGDVFYIGGSEVLPPPLSLEEEHECLMALNTEQGEDARNKLISHNLRLVVYLARKFENTGVGVEDLISIGTIGLIKGIHTFNPDKKIKLATYASRCIENEILMYFRSQKKLAFETSLNDSVDVDKDGNALTYLDIIYVEDDIADKIDAKMKTDLISKAISEVLSEREKQIIVLRFGLTRSGKIYTQREVALKLGISRSYVSRIEKSAINKINKYINNGGRSHLSFKK